MWSRPSWTYPEHPHKDASKRHLTVYVVSLPKPFGQNLNSLSWAKAWTKCRNSLRQCSHLNPRFIVPIRNLSLKLCVVHVVRLPQRLSLFFQGNSVVFFFFVWWQPNHTIYDVDVLSNMYLKLNKCIPFLCWSWRQFPAIMLQSRTYFLRPPSLFLTDEVQLQTWIMLISAWAPRDHYGR